MMPQQAADELRTRNVTLPVHRLAELFSVVDGQLWSPEDGEGLHARLADYMATNHIPASVTGGAVNTATDA